MCYGQEISNALVRARKQHVCDWCGEKIEPKTKYWRWFGVVEGDASTTKMHEECSEALERMGRELGGPICYTVPAGQPRGSYDRELDTWWN